MTHIFNKPRAILACLLTLALPGAAQTRALNPGPPTSSSAVQNGSYYALVIGIDDYKSPLPKLKTAVSDAQAIAKALQRNFGFKITLVLDAQATETEPTKFDAYITPLTSGQKPASLALARTLRGAGLAVEVGDGAFRLKKSFEAADRVARHVILLGEDELATQTATLKTFATSTQIKLPQSELFKNLSPMVIP